MHDDREDLCPHQHRHGECPYACHLWPEYWLDLAMREHLILDGINELFALIKHQGEDMSSAEDRIAADVASLTASESTMAAEFQAALDALKAANPGVDTSALDAITAKFAADATADVIPTPAPAPEPTPAPTPDPEPVPVPAPPADPAPVVPSDGTEV